jgi:hypothetical protein
VINDQITTALISVMQRRQAAPESQSASLAAMQYVESLQVLKGPLQTCRAASSAARYQQRFSQGFLHGQVLLVIIHQELFTK